MTEYVLSLLLTIAIEGCVVAMILRRFFWLETTLIQFITWPLVAVLVPRIGRLFLIESAVVIVETFLWALVLPIGLRKAAAISLIANVASVAAGQVLF